MTYFVFFLSSVLLHRIKLWKCPTCFKECFNPTKSREDKSRFGIVYSNSSVCEEYKLFIRGSLLHKKQNHRHSNVINESSRINSTLILSLHTTNTNLNIWFIIKRLQQSSTLKGRGYFTNEKDGGRGHYGPTFISAHSYVWTGPAPPSLEKPAMVPESSGIQ